MPDVAVCLIRFVWAGGNMYLDHFGLQRKPFEQLPDPDFIYLSDKHESALTNIKFAVAIQDSFVVVTGEIGSGKTTLLHKFFEEKLSDAVIAYVTQTRLSDSQLYEAILAEFGQHPFGKGKVELSYMFRNFVEEQNQRNKRVVIVVDEVQNLTPGVLEELRLITCTSPNAKWLINVVLVGQPQFIETLDSPGLKQLRQRCRLRYHLDALTPEETKHYIGHRIAVAGGDAHIIFDDDCFRLIHQHSTGIPRLINMLCDTAMMFACTEGVEKVSSPEIDQAADELGWTDGDNRSGAEDHSSRALVRAAFLKSLDAGGTSGVMQLSESAVRVGRASDCQVRWNECSLSRYHALMTRDSNGWLVSDLNSTNGTFVNDSRIKTKRLVAGDEIRFGAASFIFFEATDDLSLPEIDTGVLESMIPSRYE